MNKYSDEFYLSILESIFLRLEKLEKINESNHIINNNCTCSCHINGIKSYSLSKPPILCCQCDEKR